MGYRVFIKHVQSQRHVQLRSITLHNFAHLLHFSHIQIEPRCIGICIRIVVGRCVLAVVVAVVVGIGTA